MGQVLKRIKDAREQRTKLEAYLDRGYGSCPLRNIEVAVLVENTLLFHEAERYRLCAWVVMPNHVHALFEVWKTPMSQILYTWKRFSATRANRILNASGRFWQKEYWTVTSETKSTSTGLDNTSSQIPSKQDFAAARRNGLGAARIRSGNGI